MDQQFGTHTPARRGRTTPIALNTLTYDSHITLSLCGRQLCCLAGSLGSFCLLYAALLSFALLSRCLLLACSFGLGPAALLLLLLLALALGITSLPVSFGALAIPLLLLTPRFGLPLLARRFLLLALQLALTG